MSHRSARRLKHVALAAGLLAAAGCATAKTSNTGRTAMEQLLISNAVDQSLNRVDFQPLSGHAVFLDVTYLECVDKNYVIAATRDRVLQTGAKVVAAAADAEIVLEIRSGGVGTDQTESYVGIPGISLPGPVPVSTPEVKFWSRSQQTATAKLGLVALDSKSRQVVGHGGTAMARSDDSKTYVFGVGPFQNGSVRSEVARGLNRPPAVNPTLPQSVAFGGSPKTEPARLRLAGSNDADGGSVQHPAGDVPTAPAAE